MNYDDSVIVIDGDVMNDADLGKPYDDDQHWYDNDKNSSQNSGKVKCDPDEDQYVPFDEDCSTVKKIRRTRRRKTCNSKYSSLLSKVRNDTVHGDEEDDGDCLQSSRIRNLSVHDKYEWVNELMQLDSYEWNGKNLKLTFSLLSYFLCSSLHKFLFAKDFTKQSLVILRNVDDLLIYESIQTLERRHRTWFSNRIESVIVIPRRKYGQFYVVQGLSRSPHFSLGKKGLNKLTQLFKSKDVRIFHLCGDRKLNDPKSGLLACAYVVSSNPNEQKRSKLELGYQKKMIDLSKEVWQSLLMVSSF